jgi:hypothetical protein
MSRLDELIRELQELRAQLAELKSARRKPKLHRAPAGTPLAKAIKKMPVPPPPSYQTFLSKHNGWENFWDGLSILGVSGDFTEEALEDIDVTVEEEVASLKKPPSGTKKKYYTQKEEEDPKVIFLPNHPIFATNMNGQIALFDRRTRDVDGNMEVVLWSSDGGTLERFSSFEALLEAALADTRKQINNLGNPGPESR